jgi:glutamate--cysteine ligase
LTDKRRFFLPDLPEACFTGCLRGIEREALRIDPDGRIAQTPHPTALGAPLTHPHFTTDYSESLLEIVSSAQPTLKNLQSELERLHAFVQGHLGEERLWPLSMPPFIEDESEIPIARYGSSPQGLLRHRYRVGLAHRYGRFMQVIAGVHFNFSFPTLLWDPTQPPDPLPTAAARQLRNKSYFAILRNFARHAWVPCYLFGASPAICRSFSPATHLGSTPWNPDTLYDPQATSLRMSDIGYRNKNQQKIRISLNSLDEYTRTLSCATQIRDPDYRRTGTRNPDGSWRQLNDHVLQIENEYYSIARPKTLKHLGQRPLFSLRQEGVEYLEIRILDVDPLSPLGITPITMAFLEVFLWWCLIEDSPPLSEDERFMNEGNLRLVAYEGRQPRLRLRDPNGFEPLEIRLDRILDALEPVADHLTQATGESLYRKSLEFARTRRRDPNLTPSAWILREMEQTNTGHTGFGLEIARRHADALAAIRIRSEDRMRLESCTHQSIDDQERLERESDLSFEEYLAQYLSTDPADDPPVS